MARNKERQQKLFADTRWNSMPAAQRKKDDLFESKFTQERVVRHIEYEMMRHSERVHKPFYSDMSRSRFFSNSMRDREDHPSITSPNPSGTAHGSHLHRMQLHFRR